MNQSNRHFTTTTMTSSLKPSPPVNWNALSTMLETSFSALKLGAPRTISDRRLNRRGDHVLGFSHDATTRHFRLFRDGGEIAVTANATSDEASIDQIRRHLTHIAKMFFDANFNAPMMIHETNPPGVATMTRLKDQIRYQFSETDGGARVRIVATTPEATDAVHAFQIIDHHTGDAPTISDPNPRT